MRAGRIEEANALAARIGKEIAIRCKTKLCKVDGKILEIRESLRIITVTAEIC